MSQHILTPKPLNSGTGQRPWGSDYDTLASVSEVAGIARQFTLVSCVFSKYTTKSNLKADPASTRKRTMFSKYLNRLSSDSGYYVVPFRDKGYEF